MPETTKLPPLPDARVPVLNPDGTMRREWYQYLAALDRKSRQVGEAVEPL